MSWVIGPRTGCAQIGQRAGLLKRQRPPVLDGASAVSKICCADSAKAQG